MSKVINEIDLSKTVSGLPAPEGWYIAERREDGILWVRLYGKKLTVIEDISVKADGKRWLHVSVGFGGYKLPTYEDVQLARKLFIGEHRECYQVFPTRERYVNLGEVLHLWCCLDEPKGVLPHFEGVINGIVTI